MATGELSSGASSSPEGPHDVGNKVISSGSWRQGEATGEHGWLSTLPASPGVVGQNQCIPAHPGTKALVPHAGQHEAAVS